MDREERKKRREEMITGAYPGSNRIWSGIILLIVGSLLMAKKMGADIPNWIFQWYMLLIAIGLLISLKSGFKNAGGLIMIVVGVAFMLNDIIPDAHMQDFIWPGILMIAGVIFILRPHSFNERKRLNKWAGNWNDYSRQAKDQITPETKDKFETDPTAEYVEINAVFGSINKLVLSKNFKGGEINAFMGGAELNLLQADIQQVVQLEINTVFGGAKLVVPGNWNINNQTTAVFGGVEDKRNPTISTLTDPNKVLILKGACVFGGIEIRNF